MSSDYIICFDKKIYTDLQDIIKDDKQLFKDIESACN